MLKYQKLIEKNFNYRREIIPVFSDEELKKLTMPIELFVGEKDIMLHSLKIAKRLENLLPHANRNILLGAGHSIANLADKISTFLQLEKD
ncbi:putative carboxylesterase domain protein [Clostridium argentinense CDC 2741]|uniref:Putative carboxylesterase domain protein n=1 Tax=Clostridium argentinense CDC 2741 TaxID=1418104 RepID=A0A0C1UCG7_9CLOT|nr:alpha/beta hydrolase [Clostridium argentinense]KIE45235.1 putative carboxylesterase domain protein [Clostridium argentinense CDC 2741]